MTSDDTENFINFVRTKLLNYKHKEMIRNALNTDIQPDILAEIIKLKGGDSKENIQQAAGFTISKIAHYVFRGELDFEYKQGLMEDIKSDSPYFPELWKESFNKQDVSFSIKYPIIPKYHKGEINLENLSEDEKLITCIKVIRANADFVNNGIPILKREYDSKRQELEKQKLEMAGLDPSERNAYELWKSGFLQCDISGR